MAEIAVEARSGVVLDAMEARLTSVGIRAVVMSDLARELGMSTKTLYRLFPSKDDLVLAVIERWSERLLAAQEQRIASSMSAAERVRTAVHFFVRARSRMSDGFWEELETDHPAAWARYQTMVADGRRRSEVWMQAAMRPGVDAAFSRAVLTAAVERALDPSVRDPAGLTPEQAIDVVVEIWARGVFLENQ